MCKGMCEDGVCVCVCVREKGMCEIDGRVCGKMVHVCEVCVCERVRMCVCVR